MYEVFVDNKKILFIDSIQDFNNSLFVSVESRDLSFVYYADLLKKLPASSVIYVLCENMESTWKQFFNRFQYVEAAGGIVECGNRFLAIFRNEKWDLPKGKLEINEDPIAGAKREIEEECGVENLQYLKPLTVTYHTYEFKGNPVIKKTFWYHFQVANKQNLSPQIEEGITRAVWKNKTEMDKFNGNTYESIKEVMICFEANSRLN